MITCTPDPGGGGGGDNGEDDVLKIIDSELDPCMQDELDMLVTVEQGVGSIVQDFAIDELNPDSLGNLNWEIKDGDLPPNVNAQTYDYNANTNTVSTKFDTDKFSNATGLAVVRTMLHEAVHSHLVAYFYEDLNVFQKTYADLFQLYIETNNIEQSQHQYMADNFVNQIADALQGFGQNNGLSLSYQYYHDLAWGGLTKTEYFDGLDAAEQQRIKDNLHTEQYGTDANGNYQSQKGKSAGC